MGRNEKEGADMTGQLSIFDYMPTLLPEPAVGEYVESHGAVICHIMRSGYIGNKVVYDCSTQSHKWFRVGILEKYFENDGVMRSVINVGERQRILFDHYPGREIFECLPWNAYPNRVNNIGKTGR